MDYLLHCVPHDLSGKHVHTELSNFMKTVKVYKELRPDNRSVDILGFKSPPCSGLDEFINSCISNSLPTQFTVTLGDIKVMQNRLVAQVESDDLGNFQQWFLEEVTKYKDKGFPPTYRKEFTEQLTKNLQHSPYLQYPHIMGLGRVLEYDAREINPTSQFKGEKMLVDRILLLRRLHPGTPNERTRFNLTTSRVSVSPRQRRAL